MKSFDDSIAAIGLKQGRSEFERFSAGNVFRELTQIDTNEELINQWRQRCAEPWPGKVRLAAENITELPFLL